MDDHEIPDYLADNYRQIQSESGRSWESLAGDMDDTDPNVAAWMRAQAGEAAPEARRGAPRGRRSAARNEA